MQATGFGYAERPLFDKNNNLLNSVHVNRYLKVAYVTDYTLERDPREDLFCREDATKFICATNETLVPNTTVATLPFTRFKFLPHSPSFAKSEHMVNGEPTQFTDSGKFNEFRQIQNPCLSNLFVVISLSLQSR